MVLATLVRTMVYPENTNIGEKRINKKRKRHTPPESPLNGGMNSTIPLLGGVPFYGREGAFRIFFDILRKSPRKKNKKMRSSRRPVENTGLIRMTYEVAEIAMSLCSSQ
jgi:hypothetical protein